MGLLCGLAAAVLIVFVAAGALRLTVMLTNRVLGLAPQSAPPPTARGGGIAEWDWDDWDDEDREDEPNPAPPRGRAIPEPSLLLCSGIVFLTAFVATLGAVLLGFATEGMLERPIRRTERNVVVVVLDLPIAFLSLSVMLTVFLPTRFWRAATVSFLYGLLLGGLAMAIGAAIFVFVTILR